MVDTTIFNKYNFLEIKSDNISEIFDFCNKYDFIIVNTNINITSNQKPFCSILLNVRDNFRQYFCSKKYFLCNNKIFSFYRYYGATLNNEYLLLNDEMLFKYSEKYSNNYRYDIIKEYELLINKKLSRYDFIIKQEPIQFENNAYCTYLIRKKLKADSLLNYNICKMPLKQKINIILQILGQLYILEVNGFIYNDIHLGNILFNNSICYLIDLGAYFKKYETTNNLSTLYFNYNHYSLLECFIIFIYNLFNVRNIVEPTYFITKKNLSFLKNIFNYDINIRYFIKRFFIFIENNYNKITYTMIYNFFKQNEMIGNNVLDVKNIFINKYRYKND